MFGRLIAEAAKGRIVISMILLAFVFGIPIASGLIGFLVLVMLTAAWAVVYTGFMQLIAMKTRSAAATQSRG